MTDVFISYSRKDREIAQTIYGALIGHNRSVWMDVKDIPPNAEWCKEIQSGIQLAENFAFLISPDSIASPICNVEIDYARSLNKRLIPVVVRETDERSAHVDLVHKDMNDFQRGLLAERDILKIARDN